MASRPTSGRRASDRPTPSVTPVVAGIDVGKSPLDAHVLPLDQGRSFANDKGGRRAFRNWLLKLGLVRSPGRTRAGATVSRKASSEASAFALPCQAFFSLPLPADPECPSGGGASTSPH